MRKKHSNRLLRYHSSTGYWYFTGPGRMHSQRPSEGVLLSYSGARCYVKKPGLWQIHSNYEILSAKESAVLIIMDS